MIEELDILKIIADNPEISQRKIAEQTGVSLGQVNFLIKKFVKKGLVKLDGQTPKSIRYNLTPKGLAQKTALTLEYVKASYSAVNKLSSKVLSLAVKYEDEKTNIIACGSNDEMMDIVKIALGNKASYVPVSDLKYISIPKKEAVYFYWEDDFKTYLEDRGLKGVNILE